MLKRSRRLQPVKELAGHNERQQAMRVAEAERRLLEAERRLLDLQRYRLDYEQGFRVRATAGAPMRGLRDQQVFIARLSEAIVTQRSVVAQLHSECAQARAQWRAAATRQQAVGKAVERASMEETRMEDRRAQSESDERAQRMLVSR